MSAPRPVTVNINLRKHASKPGKVDFDPVSPVRGTDTASGKHKFVFRNRWHPGFSVRFDIIDNHGFGYRFPSDPQSAMWVHTVASENDPCPTTPVHWPGFEAVSVGDNAQGEPNRRLVVQNPNENE